jgi:predicted  nucleic acid-binding Zn-ribbon protein
MARASSADELLSARFGADPSFLRSLVFLSEGDIYAPGAGNAGLEQQLESLLPISGLSALLREIRGARKPLTRERTSQRSALQLSRDEVAQLAQDEVRHRNELDQLRVQEGALEDQYLEAADRARAREQWAAYQAEHAAWRQRMAEFAAEAGLSILDDSLDRALGELDRRRGTLEEKLHDLTERRGELAGRISVIQSFLEDLDQPGAQQCPLCRQPLDDDHRSIAITGHTSEVFALTAQREELDALFLEVRSDLARARKVTEEARSLLMTRPAEPTASGIPPEDAGAQLESARGCSRTNKG